MGEESWAGPVVRYSAAGDVLEIVWADPPTCAVPKPPSLTLLRSVWNGVVVGVKVYGVAGLLPRPDPLARWAGLPDHATVRLGDVRRALQPGRAADGG